jgi:hypothetical protein
MWWAVWLSESVPETCRIDSGSMRAANGAAGCGARGRVAHRTRGPLAGTDELFWQPCCPAPPLTLVFSGKASALSVGRERRSNLSQVARLIHLNGPPGIGKSTVASAFADQHPGVLNLDIDQVAAMIGGYSDRFSDSFEAGRLLAAAMARVHLANGHDVIMPQMMTNVNAGELACFESAAAAAKAEYCQILLTARAESAVDRCMEVSIRKSRDWVCQRAA